jgi:hypothetical protein
MGADDAVDLDLELGCLIRLPPSGPSSRASLKASPPGDEQRGLAGKAKLSGRKIAPKYRDKAGNTWSGRGAQPRWMTAAIRAGAKRDDFLIAKPAKPRKAAKRKARR